MPAARRSGRESKVPLPVKFSEGIQKGKIRLSANCPREGLAGREISAPEPAQDSNGCSTAAGWPVWHRETRTFEDGADFELFKMSQIAALFHRTKRVDRADPEK
jgi:hypothetical protein